MNLIIYLIAGAIVGYVASRIMHTNSQQGLLLDIVVGVVGAFLAGYFISHSKLFIKNNAFSAA